MPDEPVLDWNSKLILLGFAMVKIEPLLFFYKHDFVIK